MFDSVDLLEDVLENDSHRHCVIQCVVDNKYREDLQRVCELASLGNYILRQASYVEEI
jgi:hypothetical protein